MAQQQRTTKKLFSTNNKEKYKETHRPMYPLTTTETENKRERQTDRKREREREREGGSERREERKHKKTGCEIDESV
jgi:hypothetical protein